MSITKILFASALALIACKKAADKPSQPAPEPKPAAAPAAKTPTPTPAPAPPPANTKPAPNLEDVLKAQLDAVKHWSDDTPMRATFAPNAIILFTNGEHPLDDGSNASRVAYLSPDATVKEASYDHFVAGSNANVAWFTADLHFTVIESRTTSKRTIRATELLDGASDWKVVVAAFLNVDDLNGHGASPIKDATDSDALTKLLVAPDALAAALDANAVVLGTDPKERAQGPAAKALLAKWKGLKLTIDGEQKTREVHTATYGYAMANVQMTPAKGGDTKAMNAFVLALPSASGSWSVVAASYGATF